MNVFDLFAKLSLDTSEYEEGLNGAESLGSRFGSGLRGATRLAGAAIAGATTAVVGFAGTSVRAGANFDSSMSQVAATMGTTVDQIQDLRDFAQEMGATTAFSATQAADALNYMALAGYDSATSMEMLPNVLNLAAAGSIDLARASDMITDAQSALGLSLDETSTMVDQMAAAASRSNTSVEQLGDAFLTIGATASNLSGGTNELATVLGVLADNGIKGAEGGTHLRNMILSLTNPTSTAGDMLDELGIHVYDTEGNMRSMVDIIYDLQQSMEGMTQAEQDAAVGAIFNRADMASVNALLATEITRYDELSEAIGDSAGAAGDMANTQLDNLSGDITLFQSALEGAQIAISDSLTPTLREFVQLGSEGLSDVTVAFQEGGLEGAMGALGTWLSDALSKIVEMTPEIVSAGMQLLGSLGQGLVDNAPMIVSSALEVAQMLIDSFENAVNGDGASQLMETTMEIIGMLGEFLVQNAPELIGTASELIVQLVTFLTSPDNIAMIIDLSLSLITALTEGLLTAIPIIIEALPIIVNNIVTGLLTEIPVIIQAGVTLLTSLIENLPVIISTIVGALPQIIDGILSALTSNLPLIVQAGITLLTALINDLPLIVSTIAGALPQIIEGILGAITDNLPTIITAGVDLFLSLIENLPEIITGIVGAIPEIISSIVDALVDSGSEIAETALTWGADLIENLASGITNGISVVEGAVSNVAQGIRNFLGFSEPEEGPLSNFHTFAPDMVDLFSQGIDESLPTLERSLNNMSDFVADNMPSIDMADITSRATVNVDSTGSTNNQPIVVQAYFGNEKFDEYVVNSNQRNDFISGGRG